MFKLKLINVKLLNVDSKDILTFLFQRGIIIKEDLMAWPFFDDIKLPYKKSFGALYENIKI